MKLSGWASIAEIISGTAVLITLVFLVFGIRENTEITRAAAYDRNIDSLNQWRLDVAQNEELLRAWNAYRRGDIGGRIEAEDAGLGLILTALWGIYEKSYYANKYGILGVSEWSRFEVQICSSRSINVKLWNEMVKIRLTEEFADYVVAFCEDGP